jgi:hypothetical protein
MLRDPSMVVASYAFKFLFMTQTFHLRGEEVFNLAKCKIDCFLKANIELYRLDHINFSRLHVKIPPCQPNNVDKLHVHQLPCSFTCYMLFVVF